MRKNVFGWCFSDLSCPSSHKYAYLDGIYCCRTNKEKNDSARDGDLCDGSEIGIDSLCCENDDHARCGYEKCINHKDAIKNDQGNANLILIIERYKLH